MSEQPHNSDRAFSRPHPVAGIPPEGAHVEVVANDGECAQVARASGLVALERLAAEFDLSLLAGGGVRVDGTIEADVVQTCVVTLEPVTNRVRERIDVRFVPPDQIEALPAHEDAGQDESGDVEPLDGASIDLGHLAYEFMLLGLDPYPRKEGVVFEPPAVEEGAPHPFAALAGLRARMKDRPPE